MHLRHLAVLAALAGCAAPGTTHAAPEAPARWGPYSIELLDAAGAPLPTFEHRGRVHVLGALGKRYVIRVRNGAPTRAEVVVSVDGRDVLDGRPASAGKRGYVVEPYGEVAIDGFRLSLDEVAAFRFSSVPRSYAARTGDARDVGVIGVAVFPERAPPPVAYRDEREPEPAEPGGRHRGEAAPPSAAPSAPSRDAAPAPEAAEAAPPSAAGGGVASKSDTRRSARPGLGTEFGEERGSSARRVTFERARATPDAVLTVRYDDRGGLLALGIDVDGAWARRDDERRLRETATPFRRDGFAEPPPGWRR
jgi:hypothetical protein